MQHPKKRHIPMYLSFVVLLDVEPKSADFFFLRMNKNHWGYCVCACMHAQLLAAQRDCAIKFGQTYIYNFMEHI